MPPIEIIDAEKYKEAENMRPTVREDMKLPEISKEEMEKLMEEMQSPVRFQKEMAVKIKRALDNQIKHELATRGVLSEQTRKWVDTYNKILEKIQSAIYGDKSVNLHLHKVSHSDISNKIRESEFEISALKKKKKIRKSES